MQEIKHGGHRYRLVSTKPWPEDEATFQEFLDDYVEKHQLGKSSRTRYRDGVEQLLGRLREQGAETGRACKVATLTRQDLLSLFRWLNASPWAEHSRCDYWKRLGTFLRWWDKQHGPLPQEVKDQLVGDDRIRYRRKANRIKEKGILSPEEVLRLIHLEPVLSWKAFFAVTYEGGLRASEACSFRVCDAQEMKDGGYVLHVQQSKTQKRPVDIIHFAAGWLGRWIAAHPEKDNPEAKLFLNQRGEAATYASARKRFRELLKLANIRTPKVTLHSLRHSVAGQDANYLTEAQLSAKFGWVMGSGMPKIYIHRNTINVRNAIKKAHGLATGEAEEKPGPKGQICLHCSTLNPFEEKRCGTCNLPLDGKELAELKVRTEAPRMEAMLKDLLREKYKDLIAELRTEIKNEGAARGGAQ